MLDIIPLPDFPFLTNLYNAWAGIGFALLVLSAIMTGIVYMIGALLLNDKIKAWAKLEVFEIFYSAILIILLLPAVGAFNEVVKYISSYPVSGDVIAQQICAQPGEAVADLSRHFSTFEKMPFCHIKLSMYFLASLFEEMSNVAFKIYMYYFASSTLADASLNIEFVTEKAGFFTFNPWRGFFTPQNLQLNMMFEFLTKLMTITKIQEVFIAFTATALFPTLLIIGVILRTFVFTRKLGGLLMAIALSLFFIYPMFYVAGAFIIDRVKVEVAAIAHAAGIEDLAGVEGFNRPIADYLFLGGNVPLVGGGFNLGEAERSWQELSRQSHDDVLRAGGRYARSGGDIPNIDSGTRLNVEDRPDFDAAMAEELDRVNRELGSKDYKSDFTVEAFKEGGLIDVVARLSFFSLIFSLFAVLGTIAGIRSMSITFGGDVEIAGLTHLI